MSTRRMSAVVIFATRFGTTERVARSLETGLKGAGLETLCDAADKVPPDSLKQYDLICVGGPTEIFSATKPMKEFLKATQEVDLEGKLGFAFDTKLDSRMSGSAGKYIEHALDDQGLHIVARRESAFVTSTKKGSQITGAVLRLGEEQRFELLGKKVGAMAIDAAPETQIPA